MKRTSLTIIGLGSFMALTLVATTARAQGAPDRGPEVGLRTGLMLPFGDVSGGMGGGTLDNYASKALPFVLEGGFRFDSNLFAGLRFQYAIPDLKGNTCAGAASCDGSVVTLGVEGTYRLMPGQTFVPWVGAGIGYEWASVDRTGGLFGNGGATFKGFQPLLQAGGDIYVTPKLFLGPFVEAAFGRFDTLTTRATALNSSFEMDQDITNESWHMWLTLGVRGAFDI